MCNFFSFVGDGHGNFKYHDWEDRVKIGANSYPGPDSHTHILSRMEVPADKQDRWSKYEFNPLTKLFTVDCGVDGHDHESARNWVEALDFKGIIPALRIKNIVHPFRVVPPKKITKKHIALIVEWASVGASVGDSVWASVRDSVGASVRDSVGASVGASVRDLVRASMGASVWASVRDSVGASVRASVWAYVSSFFAIEYKHCFTSAVQLWDMGLIPSFDGKLWRLHGGPRAKVLWQGTLSESRKEMQ